MWKLTPQQKPDCRKYSCNYRDVVSFSLVGRIEASRENNGELLGDEVK